jgi:hypothetical protein
MDLKTKQDLEFYESEKRDKERMEEFYKNAFTFQPEEKDVQLTKEELRIARLRYFEKKIDLNKPT